MSLLVAIAEHAKYGREVTFHWSEETLALEMHVRETEEPKRSKGFAIAGRMLAGEAAEDAVCEHLADVQRFFTERQPRES